MASPQQIIVLSVGVATANNVVANATKADSKPWFPVVMGGLGISVGLLIASEFQSEVATGFAVLILVASLIGPNGTALANLLVNLTGGSMGSSPTPRTSTIPNTRI